MQLDPEYEQWLPRLQSIAATGTLVAVDAAAPLDIRASGNDVDWTGITNLAEVVGGCAPPGFSGVALEKEVNGRRATWDCAVQSEARESDTQRRRHAFVVITGFLHFFRVHS